MSQFADSAVIPSFSAVSMVDTGWMRCVSLKPEGRVAVYMTSPLMWSSPGSVFGMFPLVRMNCSLFIFVLFFCLEVSPVLAFEDVLFAQI